MSSGNDNSSMLVHCGPRGRDVTRRGDLRDVLEALAATLARDAGDRDLLTTFEQELQRSLCIRTVRLREIPARYHARLVTPTRTADSIVLSVSSPNPRVQAVLEASCEPSRPLGERDHDALTTAAYLASLVLELARVRIRGRARFVDGAAPLIGSSMVMQTLRDRIERAAVTDFPILIEGESGTGKELVARQLHELSHRRGGPFVAVNCAALVETLLEAELFGIEERTATGVRGRRGKFEHAHGGTLFLDEVSDLSIAAQAKLLRTIQDLSVERVGGIAVRRVDTRIIVATNRPLAEMVDRRLFRADLFYRLCGVEIHVPPLRERRDDVVELANYFLARHRQMRDLTLSPTAADALRVYSWPGNVRELQRVIERTVALTESSSIEIDDLPAHVRGDYAEAARQSVAADMSMRAWASRYARLVYERCRRNKRHACRVLNISYHTLEAYLRHTEVVQAPSKRRWPAWVRSVTGDGTSEAVACEEPEGSCET
jgi:DNA-binding NtrC family response regulator